MTFDSNFEKRSNKPNWLFVAIIVLITLVLSFSFFYLQNNNINLIGKEDITKAENTNLATSQNTAKESEVDSDNDGLSDIEEKRYGTDPLKNDSDGDGYFDKDEIDAGYNPVGSGKLKEYFTNGITKNPENKQDCYDSHNSRYDGLCMAVLAKEKFDYSLCKISNNPDVCYKKTAIYNLDYKGCSMIESDGSRDLCLIDLAFAQKDDNVCKFIFNKKLFDNCVSGAGEQAESIDICKKIVDLEKEGMCIRAVAKSKNRSDICAEINNELQKNWCYYDVAINNNDENLCLLINDEERRDYCFSVIALNQENVNLCEKISETSRKNYCLNHLYNKSNINQEKKIEIAQDILEKNFVKFIIYEIIFLIIGILIFLVIANWAINKVVGPNNRSDINFKIVAICGLTGFLIRVASIIIKVYLPSLTVIVGIISLLDFIFIILIFCYLLKRWYNMFLADILKVLGLIFLIVLVVAIIIYLINRGIYYLLVIYSLSQGGFW